MLKVAIHFYRFRTQTIFVSLPLIVAVLFTLIFAVIGGLFAGGMIRREVYVGLMIVTSAILVVALLVAASAFIYFLFRRTY